MTFYECWSLHEKDASSLYLITSVSWVTLRPLSTHKKEIFFCVNVIMCIMNSCVFTKTYIEVP